MKHLIWIYPTIIFDLHYVAANQEHPSSFPYEIAQEEIQNEDNTESCEEDLIVDRDRNRGRDERRNLYEYNRDTLRQEAEKQEWKKRNMKRAYKNSFSEEL